MVSTTASSPAGPPARLQGPEARSLHMVGWAGSEAFHYLQTFKSQGIPQKIQILNFSWKTRRHGDTGHTSTSGKDQQAERGCGSCDYSPAHARQAAHPSTACLAPGVTAVPSSEQPKKFAARGTLLTSRPVSQAPSAGQTSSRNEVPVAPLQGKEQRPAASPDRDFLCHLRSHFLNLPDTELL